MNIRRSPRARSEERPLTFRAKLLRSLGPGLLGGAVGWAYWYYGHPELRDDRWLMNMYGCMGAVLGIMSLRVAALLRAMFNDFFGSNG